MTWSVNGKHSLGLSGAGRNDVPPNPVVGWRISYLSIAPLPAHCINVFTSTEEIAKQLHLVIRGGLGSDRCRNGAGCSDTIEQWILSFNRRESRSEERRVG